MEEMFQQHEHITQIWVGESIVLPPSYRILQHVRLKYTWSLKVFDIILIDFLSHFDAFLFWEMATLSDNFNSIFFFQGTILNWNVLIQGKVL